MTLRPIFAAGWLVLAVASTASGCSGRDDAFRAQTPHAAIASESGLYGQFIGHWDVVVTDYPLDGSPRTAKTARLCVTPSPAQNSGASSGYTRLETMSP